MPVLFLVGIRDECFCRPEVSGISSFILDRVSRLLPSTSLGMCFFPWDSPFIIRGTARFLAFLFLRQIQRVYNGSPGVSFLLLESSQIMIKVRV